MEVFTNVHVGGQLSMKSVAMPAESITDADVAAAAGLQSTKFQTQQQHRYSQSQGVNIADDECLTHIFRLPSEIIAVEVTPIVPPIAVTPHVVITRIQAGRAAQNEKQTLTLYGTPTGGNFKLTVTANASTQQTANIAYNTNAAGVQSALEALSNIAPGDVVVTGGSLPGTAVVIEFTGTLAAVDVPLIVVDASGLTGGSIYASVNTVIDGSADDVENQLEGFWTFDEASGTRSDSVGNLDLSDYGTNGNDSGVVGDAIQMVAGNTAYLFSGHVTANCPRVTQNFTLCGWYRQDSARGLQTILNFQMRSGGGPWSEVRLLTDEEDKLQFDLWGGSPVQSATFGSIPDDTWVFFACRWNASTKITRLSVNAGSSDSGSPGDGVDDSAATTVGLTVANQVGATTINLDEVGLWSRELSDEEIEFLYNAGAGQTLPFGINEVQQLITSGSPTTGSVDVTFDGSTTTLLYNETASAAQAKLRALASINGANCNVTGSWPGTLTVTFVGDLAITNLPAMTVADSKIKSSVTTTQLPITARNEQQQIAISGDIGGGAFTLSFNHGSNQTTAACAYNLSNATLDTRLEDLSNIGSGDITVTLGTLPVTAVVVEFGGSLAAQALSLMTADDANLTIASPFYTVDVGVANVNNTSFVSLLEDPITIDTDSVPRSPINASIAEAMKDRDPADVLMIVVDASGTSANPGQGLNVVIHSRAYP